MGKMRKDTVEQINLAVDEVFNGIQDGVYNNQNMTLGKYVAECFNVLKSNVKYSTQNGWNTERDTTSAIMLSGKESILKEIETQLKNCGIENYI